jgi:hypothetical protein
VEQRGVVRETVEGLEALHVDVVRQPDRVRVDPVGRAHRPTPLLVQRDHAAAQVLDCIRVEQAAQKQAPILVEPCAQLRARRRRPRRVLQFPHRTKKRT